MLLTVNGKAFLWPCLSTTKLWLSMKLTLILSVFFCLNVCGTGYAQRITLEEKNASLQSVFKKIERQSNYLILYRDEWLADAKKVTVHLVNSTIEEAMSACLNNQQLEYAVVGNSIVIKRKAVTSSKNQPANDIVARPIKGLVLNENGEPLSGATVTVKGTKLMTVVNDNGEFSFADVPENAVLVISNVGFVTREIAISGKDNIKINLQQAQRQMQEVVVTALGIRREERSLGYSAQKVEGEEVTRAPTSNWVNALTGKVPGLQLNKVGGPAGSSDIVLRGDNVLDLGGSTALIVIDGVPVSTQQAGTGYGALVAADNPIDFGSSLSDLNPEDIESVSVLKGPAAAALYGSRASNGAIIITTKSGKKTPGTGLYFNSTITHSTINRYPDYQFEYGAGSNGATYYSYGNTADGTSTKNSTAGYGPRYEGQSYFQYNSPFDASVDPNPLTSPRLERVPWRPYKNYVSGFFRPGMNIANTIGITGAGYRAAITYTKNTWIVPNTGFDRINIALSGSQKVSPKITLNSKINYARKFSDNLPTQGYNNQTIMYYMAQTASSFDINWFKQRWENTTSGIAEIVPVSNGYLDNPYVIAYEMLNGADRHNVIGNVNAVVQFTDKLSLMLRTGLDLSYEFRSQQRPINTNKFKEGMYRQQNVFRLENNSDFLLKYENKLPFGLNYTVSVGGNQRFNDYKWDDAWATKLSLPGVYNLSNSKDPIQTTSDRYQFMVNSLYGFVNLGYKDKVYLELTGRNDWSSTLPKQNASFFYPSVNTSVLLDKVFELPTAISFAKLRASYASTGVDAKDPYGFQVNYSRTQFPGSLQMPTRLPNVNLKPQFTNAIELGLDLRFLKNRAGIDLAIYRNITRNQILSLPVDGATGFSTALTNVGKVQNKGIEVQLRGTPVQKRNFKWDVLVNWSANRNKVIDVSSALGAEGKLVLYNVGFANINIVAEEGKPLGQLYGLGFKRSPEGKVVFNSSGIPVMNNELQNWGSINPDWQGGIQNNITWKNFNFSVLFDVRRGGKMMSYSHAILAATGKLKNSLPGREGGVTGDGVQVDANGHSVPNTVKAPAATYYNAYYLYSNMETNVFSTSFVKFREASIGYHFPKSWFKKSFVQELSLAASGRDLFVWTDFPSFDPETATLNSSQIMPGIEIGQFPSTRSITFTLNAKF